MSKKGLSIIAAESQNTGEAKIKGILDEHKAEFTVTRQVRGPLSSRGIPHAYVFDVEGQLIFNGSPGGEDFEKVVKNALKDYEDEPADDKKGGDLFRQRTWTNSEGQPLVAAVTEIDGDKLTFRLKNGRKIPYEISKLSEEDQKMIQEKAAE